MPAITVQCTHCGASLKLKDRDNVGRKVACPKCALPFVIRASAGEGEIAASHWDEFDGDLGEPLPARVANPPVRARSSTKRSTRSTRASSRSAAPIVIGSAAGLGLLGVVVGVLWMTGVLGTTTTETGFDSPQTAFDAMQAGIVAHDWESAASCMTEESQEMFATGLLFIGGLVSAFGGNEASEIVAVLEKYNIDLDEQPDPDDGIGAFPIDDKPAFIGDMMAALENVDDFEDGPYVWMESSRLADLEIDGNRATATVVTQTPQGEEREPIEFRKSNGSWLVHLDESGFMGSGLTETTTPITTSDSSIPFETTAVLPPSTGDGSFEVFEPQTFDGGFATNEPLMPPHSANEVAVSPIQTLENGLSLQLTVERDRPFEFLSMGNFPDGALYATISISGPQITSCSEYGFYRIDVAVDDRGNNLPLIGGAVDDFGRSYADGFVELDTFFLQDPNTLPIRCVLQPVGNIDSIAQLKASLQLKLRSTVVVDDILTEIDQQPLVVPALNSVGTFRVVTPDPDEAQPGQGIVIEYTASDDAVAEMELLDADGNIINCNRFSFGFNGTTRYSLDAGQPLPSGTKLRIALTGHDELLDVPLDFENISIANTED